jgi:prolyl-tRNA synthetase
MVVQQSKLFGLVKRTPPRDATAASHRLLVQAAYIDQLAAGIFTLLPLGFRVHRRIENLIREEMNELGAQEVLLPVLQPRALWRETGRWQEIDPPLFRTKDRHGRVYGLGSTHEEVVTDLARRYLTSYRQLPVAVYQIHVKFRNEQRPTGGLLRTREFIMKDLYSFHPHQRSLEEFYVQVREAYLHIFQQAGLQAVPLQAPSGTIGGKISHEFGILSAAGEDRILVCAHCSFAANAEHTRRLRCPHCHKKLEQSACIEAGHIFQLGTNYSRKMNAHFQDAQGKQHLVVMGCYGIGVGRFLAAVVEEYHDERGLRWPPRIAPFDVHVIELPAKAKEQSAIRLAARKVVKELVAKGWEVLWDEREDCSAGEKLVEADLIGIPARVVVSARHLAKRRLGWKLRWEKREKGVSASQLQRLLRDLRQKLPLKPRR